MMRRWLQQRRPPAYVAELHVGFCCAPRSAPSWVDTPSHVAMQERVHAPQLTPPVSHIEAEAPSAHKQVLMPVGASSTSCAPWWWPGPW